MEKIYIDHSTLRDITVETVDGFFIIRSRDKERDVRIVLGRNQAINLYDELSDQIDAVTNAKRRKQPLKYTKGKYTTLPKADGRLRRVIPKD